VTPPLVGAKETIVPPSSQTRVAASVVCRGKASIPESGRHLQEYPDVPGVVPMMVRDSLAIAVARLDD
jgi:hypothetical protein